MGADQEGREACNHQQGLQGDLPPTDDGINPRLAQEVLPFHEVEQGHHDECVGQAQAEGLKQSELNNCMSEVMLQNFVTNHPVVGHAYSTPFNEEVGDHQN